MPEGVAAFSWVRWGGGAASGVVATREQILPVTTYFASTIR